MEQPQDSHPTNPHRKGDAAKGAKTGEARPEAAPESPVALDRLALTRLGRANQGRLLHHWLKRHSGLSLEATSLEALLAELQPREGPGERFLGKGWRLRWTRPKLVLLPPEAGPGPH
jgi:hypothetical protein